MPFYFLLPLSIVQNVTNLILTHNSSLDKICGNAVTVQNFYQFPHCFCTKGSCINSSFLFIILFHFLNTFNSRNIFLFRFFLFLFLLLLIRDLILDLFFLFFMPVVFLFLPPRPRFFFSSLDFLALSLFLFLFLPLSPFSLHTSTVISATFSLKKSKLG